MSINNKEFKIKDDPFEIKNKFVKKELKILSHKFAFLEGNPRENFEIISKYISNLLLEFVEEAGKSYEEDKRTETITKLSNGFMVSFDKFFQVIESRKKLNLFKTDLEKYFNDNNFLLFLCFYNFMERILFLFCELFIGLTYSSKTDIERFYLKKMNNLFNKIELKGIVESFSQLKEQIESISWPKKLKNKLTQKGNLSKKYKEIDNKIKSCIQWLWSEKLVREIKIEYPSLVKELNLVFKNKNSTKNQIENQENSKKKELYENDFSTEDRKEIKNILDYWINKDILYLNKVQRRLESIFKKDSFDEDELMKISEYIDKNYSDNLDPQVDNVVSEIKDSIWDILNKKNCQEAQKEDTSKTEEVEEKLEQEQKIDNYSETEYEEFIKFILSPNWLNVRMSNTNNPENLNSQWDWSFVKKFWRPFFQFLEKLFYDWILDPENVSWKIICDQFFKNENSELTHFLNVLKNFDENWDLFEIFPSFIEAVEKFSETNYYNHKETPLLTIISRLQNILEKFNKNLKVLA